MSEAVRRKGELMRALFAQLIDAPDGMMAKDALKAVERSIELTAFEKGSYKDGARRFEKLVRFSTITFVKAGWLVKADGIWSVTPEGAGAYKTITDPVNFHKRARQLYLEWRAKQPDAGSSEDEGLEEEVSEKDRAVDFEEIRLQARSDISGFLKVMPPYEFQELVACLLRAMGYYVAWIAPPGKDGGIDVLAQSDPLNTRPPRIKVQVKRQEQKISVDGLRSFMAVLNEDDVGLFVSTGGFTKDAMDEARTQEKRKVTLIDLEKFFDLWIEHYEKLDDEAHRRFPLKPVYFLSPEP
ncbi:MAG: restriction endonuclease [Burkholderiales bacterium]|nr:restriction endonuclease [Burkholderiales bacterium]MCW5604544.1 restriction endonuclease [Burkholderiales bacterium]